VARISLIIALGVVILAAAACGSSGTPGRLSVVTAFYPLAYAAEEIGGGSVKVENLTPPGAEPHDIELTPRQAVDLQRAKLVLYLSHGFQPAVEKAVDGVPGKKLDALAGVSLKDGVGDETGKTDPHVWLDPILFARIVTRIGAALGQPRRAAALATRVRELDGEYRRGLANCRQHAFVTSHAAFGYLAARYGLHQIAITGVDPESEPSPRKLADLARLVRRDKIKTVFFERLVSPKLSETVARAAGARTAVLDPIEGLTPSEAKRGYTYLTLMRQNLQALRTALGCR
jgi:zinc transport system substrate-binding protein